MEQSVIQTFISSGVDEDWWKVCEKVNPIYLVIKQIVLISSKSCLLSLNSLIIWTPPDQQGLFFGEKIL